MRMNGPGEGEVEGARGRGYGGVEVRVCEGSNTPYAARSRSRKTTASP